MQTRKANAFGWATVTPVEYYSTRLHLWRSVQRSSKPYRRDNYTYPRLSLSLSLTRKPANVSEKGCAVVCSCTDVTFVNPIQQAESTLGEYPSEVKEFHCTVNSNMSAPVGRDFSFNTIMLI